MTTLSDGPSFKGQQRVTLRLEGAPSLLNSTVTTGLIANTYQVGINNINGFAARFGSTFTEYRILAADFQISPLSASNGVSKMWFDEKSSATPTINESMERTSTMLTNTNAMSRSKTTMRWRARDLLDLQYTAIGTTVIPVNFKIYTDNSDYGAPIAVAPIWLIEPTFTVEFRELAST